MIAGGGELATAREVLKHKSVERVTLVEIDGAVVEAAKKFLGEWGSTNAFLSDPRLSIVVDDAAAWIDRYTGPALDVVILDISDPDFGMDTENKQNGTTNTTAVKSGPTHPIYQPV